MAGFSDGLMAGFQFVEGIVDRRERRRLADEELGLRRAANSRAEAAFTTQQELIADERLRQQRTDRSNAVFARGQRVGFDNLEPYEMAELEELAAYNPNIAGALQEHRSGRQADEDIATLYGSGRAPTGPQGLARVAQQAPQQAPPTPAADEMSPLQVQAYGGLGGEMPEGEGDGATRTVHNTYVRGLIPGFELPNELINPRNGTVELPAQMVADLDAAKDLPLVERQKVIDQYRTQLGDPAAFSATVAESKRKQAAARDLAASWRGFLDPADEVGADLRRIAAEDPLGAALEFRRDYKTLQSTDPNTLASVIPQMAPVVDQAVRISGNRVASLPRNENGRIAMNAETRKTLDDWNHSLDLMSTISDSFDEVAEATIRAGTMPVGNQQLTEQLTAAIAQSPAPGRPLSDAEFRAARTLTQRAMTSLASGGRNMSTKQVQAAARLVRHGVLSTGALERLLSTGSLDPEQDADAIKFMELKDGSLIRHDAAGNFEIVHVSTDPKDKDKFPGEHLKWIDTVLAPPPNATDWQIAESTRARNELISTLVTNPEALHMAGMPADDIGKLTPQQLTVLAMRQQAIKPVAQAAYNNQWFWGTNWILRLAQQAGAPLGKTQEEVEAGLSAAGRELDQMARDYAADLPPGTAVPPLPTQQFRTDAARMRMIAEGDEVQRLLAIIGSETAINNAIAEQVAAEGPAQ